MSFLNKITSLFQRTTKQVLPSIADNPEYQKTLAAAEAGDAKAMFMIQLKYGSMDPQNEWLMKSSQLGYPDAMAIHGIAQFSGLCGIPMNKEEGLNKIKHALSKDSFIANAYCGKDAFSSNMDVNLTKKYFRTAVRLWTDDMTPYAWVLGIHATFLYQEKKYKEAYELAMKGSQYDDCASYMVLATIATQGNIGATDWNLANLYVDKALHSPTLSMFPSIEGWAYFSAFGCANRDNAPADRIKSVKYLERAVNLNNPDAMRYMANMYRVGAAPYRKDAMKAAEIEMKIRKLGF